MVNQTESKDINHTEKSNYQYTEKVTNMIVTVAVEIGMKKSVDHEYISDHVHNW